MRLSVGKNDNGVLGLFTSKAHVTGDVIFELKGDVLKRPTQTSVKIGPGKHIVDLYGIFLNHSCNPNVRIIGQRVCAVKDIFPKTELCFDYRATEGNLHSPFTCFCCGNYITGEEDET